MAIHELAVLFLRLGATAFGGPAAHIALMRLELVERRRWLTDQEYVDLVGAANMIPGPNSTEVAIHVGYARAGWRGLLTAGICFIVPSMLMVGGLAWIYVEYGSLPDVRGVLYGVTPVVVAIIAQALWTFGHTSVTSTWLACVGLAALIAAMSLAVASLGALAGYAVLLVAAVIGVTFAFGLGQPALMEAVGDAVADDVRGVALGIATLFFLVGGGVGSAVVGGLGDVFGIPWALLGLAALPLVGLLSLVPTLRRSGLRAPVS